MPTATLEEILEEESKALPADEREQLREVLASNLSASMSFLLAAGLIYLLAQRNTLSHDERRRLYEMLNRAAIESGLVKRGDTVREIRGKYSYIRTSSEDFAARKREEVRLEDL